MTEKERLIAKTRARKFAMTVREVNLAMFPPAEWDELTDEQIRYALSVLPQFGVVRRNDWRWEPKRY